MIVYYPCIKIAASMRWYVVNPDGSLSKWMLTTNCWNDRQDAQKLLDLYYAKNEQKIVMANR